MSCHARIFLAVFGRETCASHGVSTDLAEPPRVFVRFGTGCKAVKALKGVLVPVVMHYDLNSDVNPSLPNAS